MEKISVNSMPIEEGLKVLLKITKAQYVAENMSGGTKASNANIISRFVNGKEVNGRTYYFTDEQVEELQDFATTLGTQLMSVTMTAQPQSEQASPMCYGNDYIQKFKVLRKYINLPYLFVDCMGKSIRWQKMHLNDKASVYLNTFKPSELDAINTAIRTIALQLCSLKFSNENLPDDYVRIKRKKKIVVEEPTPEQSFPDPFADFN